MTAFKEPRPNKIVIAFAKMILPFWLKFKEHLTIDILCSQANRKTFALSKRAVILLNHPDRQDPFVIVKLASDMREEVYCIAARECFDWDNGWRGWLFQRLGCYSVARGKADFHSIATTEKILRDGRRKLVIFPEAEITADENTVHDLHKAIFHVLLNVQSELPPADAASVEKSVQIFPAAIKLALVGDLTDAVAVPLHKIESRLALNPPASTDVLQRIDQVVDAYLSLVLRTYDCAKPDSKLEQLAEETSIFLLQKIELRLGASIDADLSPTDKLYALRNMAEQKIDAASVAIVPDVFHCAGVPKSSLRSDFERVERLLILQRMLQHQSSEIQRCRILDFIESELFGTISAKGQQSCKVELGQAIAVASFVDKYVQVKEDGVAALSEDFRVKLQQMVAAGSP